MTVRELRAFLRAHPGLNMHWMFPDWSFVPTHCHITEVGRVQKDFIDCGGTVRSMASCLIQIWVADDTDHRIQTTKLAKILDVAGSVLKQDDLPVEIEYEDGVVAQYPLAGAELTPSGVLFSLGTKHTACLAPDACGIGGTGCC